MLDERNPYRQETNLYQVSSLSRYPSILTHVWQTNTSAQQPSVFSRAHTS